VPAPINGKAGEIMSDAAFDADRKRDQAAAATLESLAELKRTSQVLKEKIIDEKKRHDMPINSSLGSPKIDAENADGRNDLPDSDDD
jgi:hypothetical protein